jgi:hypothetical protein
VKIAETGKIHWNEHKSASGSGSKGFCQLRSGARWEADGKMRRKVNFLQQPLLDSQMGPSELIQAKAEAILEDDNRCLQDAPP